MVRVKRGVSATRKREKILKKTKGFKWGRKSKERAAREALLHAYTHAYRGRKEKKREQRHSWNIKINAGARLHGIPYSKLVPLLKKKHIMLDRKMLAHIAQEYPEVFAKIIEAVTK